MAGLQIDTDALAAIAHAEKNLAQDKSHSDYSHDQKYDPEAPVQDGIHDGLEFPTDEERITLRRVTDTIPWNSFLIAFIELVERFSYYGTTVVFTNYIQQPLPDGSRTGAGGRNGQSGALGKGQRASTGLTTFNQFWVYFIPLFGAYVADTYWGRYKTVCVSVGIALFGHVLLIISSVPGVIEHPDGSLACFIVALIIMGLGTGGFKPNTSPLVAEQYKKTRLFIRYTKSGEKVIVDPSLTTSSIYMYFYLFINIGALVGQIGMTYSEKYVGFWLAYMLPTALFLLCPIVLFYGRNRYICSPPTGSVLGRAIRVCNFAARGRWSWNPIKCYTQMKAPGFWDAAKPSMLAPGDRPAWMTYNDVWVDELRRGLAACKVFVWFPIYWLTYNQINNNLTSQAATMVTNGVPNDVLSNLDPLALIIFIPICDLFLYPGLRRLGFNFTPIKKMTLGFYTGAAAMAWAAVLQHYIYITNPCGYYVSTCSETSNLNVWIQTGSYVLIAFSEILASITSLEYAFTKAPKNMRSLVMSVCLFTTAVSAAIGEAFVSLSSDPLLVWNYGSMGVLSFVAGVLFWFTFKDLDAMEDQLNQIPAGGF
ncbi:PTR2-domain-containing protein [Thelephora terrestris]|uniref:PTR2-domain-containing protein n=1 Tax=Thelephora terrestris TaxID=56493 RepID=A0A9P6HJN6_9AGAM|nr:PTR2-domain-containing protein [Thelephora terrestris]